MYINADGFAAIREPMLQFGIDRHWAFDALDQGHIRDFLEQSLNHKIPVLPDKYNWKGYWGASDDVDVTILHFHGPKPCRSCCLPCLLSFPDSYKEHCGNRCRESYIWIFFNICQDKGQYYKQMLQVYNEILWEAKHL